MSKAGLKVPASIRRLATLFMGQSRPMPRLWQNVAMALVGEASAILAAPKVQPASIVRDMRYQGDSGPSHAIVRGWSGG